MIEECELDSMQGLGNVKIRSHVVMGVASLVERGAEFEAVE